MKKSLLLICVILISHQTIYSQDKNSAPKAVKSTTNDSNEKMLDYSRPTAYHAELNKLVGTWNYQDTKLVFVKGILIRNPVFDGRFFNVEITGGKLLLPVAEGLMKEDNYKSIQMEEYDNSRMKYVTTSVNNHIGSGIQVQTGTYDAPKKEFTYQWESELIPGQKKQNRRVLKIIDSDHYIENYYELTGSDFLSVRQLDYSRVVSK